MSRKDSAVIGTNHYPDLDRWHRAALWASMRMMCDEALADICSAYDFKDDQRMSPFDSYLVGLLPDRRPFRYTPGFVCEFAICVLTVAWKLAEPTTVFRLASTAERLALDIIIREAESLLEDAREDEVLIPDVPLDLCMDFLPFCRAVFGDETEFRRLYLRGPCELKRCHNLRFEDWFEPFNTGDYVQPHVIADWPPQLPSDLGWFSAVPHVEVDDGVLYGPGPSKNGHGPVTSHAPSRTGHRQPRGDQDMAG